MSRLLHTSDWHLGAALSRYSREEDFDAVLTEIVSVARETRPDLIIHSGDLFHSFRPGARVLLRAARTLRRLAAFSPTVVIAGNHDNAAYFRFLRYLASPAWGRRAGRRRGRRRNWERNRGLYFIDQFHEGAKQNILTFSACGGRQRLRLAAMPFTHPNTFWQHPSPSGSASADYAQGMRKRLADVTQALHDGYVPGRDVLLFAAHMYVSGATRSASERAMDTDADFATAPGNLPVVSYAALGDIHAPQAVRGVDFPARYAGSPLQMDFGEHKDTKSVVIVDVEPGRPALVDPLPLTGGRRLAYFKGTLDELRAEAGRYEGMFLKARITDEEDAVLLHRKIAGLVPGAILVDAQPVREAPAGSSGEEALGGDADLAGSFLAYLTAEGLPETAARSTASAFAQLLSEVDHEEPPATRAEELLRAALDNPWRDES